MQSMFYVYIQWVVTWNTLPGGDRGRYDSDIQEACSQAHGYSGKGYGSCASRRVYLGTPETPHMPFNNLQTLRLVLLCLRLKAFFFEQKPNHVSPLLSPLDFTFRLWLHPQQLIFLTPLFKLKVWPWAHAWAHFCVAFCWLCLTVLVPNISIFHLANR